MIIKHSSRVRRTLALLALSVPLALTGVAALGGARASASTVNAQAQQSENWAGYVVHDNHGQNFSSVSGSWTQPAVSAGSGQGYSAFWVGLGGGSQQSQALEQIGTSANVVKGKTQYSAWYELVPAPERKLSLAIQPGDHMSGRVTVNGRQVTLALSDQTSGQSVTKTLQMNAPDTSSAEWIAEAPSAENPGGGTQILPLANFGKVTFTNARATAGGHTGSISDPNWTAQQIQLNSSGGIGFPGAGNLGPGPRGLSGTSGAGASTSPLADGGRSFSVSYDAGDGSQPSTGGAVGYPPGVYGYPGSAYGGSYLFVLPGGYVVVVA
jgi:hypothetical protein